jgi:Na+/proline symporter
MILSKNNPLYNTIIIFIIIILFLYFLKPEILCHNNKFKKINITKTKKINILYIVGIILALFLYILFNYLCNKNNKQNFLINKVMLEQLNYLQNKIGTN